MHVPGRINNVRSCIKIAISLKFALSYLKEFCTDRSNGKSAIKNCLDMIVQAIRISVNSILWKFKPNKVQ